MTITVTLEAMQTTLANNTAARRCWRDGYDDDYCWVKPGTEQLILDAFAEAAGSAEKTIRSNCGTPKPVTP